MSKIDYARVAALLEIAERCTGHSGKLSSLQSAAIGELLEINQAIKDEAAPPKAIPTPTGPEPEADDGLSSESTDETQALRRL